MNPEDELHEGLLSDPTTQRGSQKQAKHIRRTYTEDLLTLEKSPHFRRWFGKFAEPRIMLGMQTTNGGDLQHFMGQRNLLLEMIKEFEDFAPGFYERVLSTRRALQNELRPEPKPEED